MKNCTVVGTDKWSIFFSILALQKECDALGTATMESRGQMMHFILRRCRDFETAFAELVDRGRGGKLHTTMM